jgi:hypothetical protein
LYNRYQLGISLALLAVGAGGCSQSTDVGDAAPLRSPCRNPAQGNRFSVCGSVGIDRDASASSTSPSGASLRGTVGVAHQFVTSQSGEFELGGGYNAIR